MTVKNFLKENKEGIIIGGIIGYVAGKWFIPNDFDFSVVAQTQGIVDAFKGTTTSAIEFAKTKVTFALVLIGAGIGALIDNQMKEGWLRRWF